MSLRDLYAKELGYKDADYLADLIKTRENTYINALEGLVISHVMKALSAVEQQLQPKGSSTDA